MKLLKTSTLLLCMTASGCSYFQTQDASSQPAKAPAEPVSYTHLTLPTIRLV